MTAPSDSVVRAWTRLERAHRAALVMKAPSYASSLLTLPSPSYEPGGISLTFDR